jgi:DNA-binding transcriptional LysR family regulator
MEMQQVRYFLSVAQTLNFTRAAEQCNVSQPALTRAIKLLEEELGGDLIRREGRLSHLTELGKQMLPLLRQCYDSALNAKSLAKSLLQGEVATLTLAISRAFDLTLLLPHLAEMYRSIPGLQFRLRRGNAADIAEMLKRGEVDLAIGGPLRENWERLDVWPMFTESFDLVVAPDHQLTMLNDIDLDVELIRDARFLMYSGLDASPDEIERLALAGINLANAHEVDSDRDLEALVAANLGIGVLPSSALNVERVRHLQLASLDIRRTISIYSVAGRSRSREAAALLTLLRGAEWPGRRRPTRPEASPPSP